MAKIIVHLNIDESAILAETGQENLTDAIIQKLERLQSNGLTMDGWDFNNTNVEPGTPVYVLEPCYCTSAWVSQCGIRNGTSVRKKKENSVIAVFTSQNRKGREYCWKLYKRPYDPIKHLALLGRRVFKTEAEARMAAISKVGK